MMNKEVEILKMPKWGMTMTEGTIVSWLKKETIFFQKEKKLSK